MTTHELFTDAAYLQTFLVKTSDEVLQTFTISSPDIFYFSCVTLVASLLAEVTQKLRLEIYPRFNLSWREAVEPGARSPSKSLNKQVTPHRHVPTSHAAYTCECSDVIIGISQSVELSDSWR
ncbi:hypothetical protein HanIR_Chr04g0190291 [Helianthus annuus]|nr:hypothetical protein HanIR_Chr04g0190291 [Helianthus annuus]